MKKVCSKCKQEKDYSEYNKHPSGKYGLQPKCKSCYLERSRQNRIAARTWLKEYLSTKQCRDCGTTDVRVLEFDHIKDDKYQAVANLVAKGFVLETIQKEINKCEIVCANCHRIRTITRQGKSWRLF